MYKVFINNIPLYLAADDKLLTENSVVKISCSDPKEGKPVVQQFKNGTIKKPVLLLHPDPESLVKFVFNDHQFIEAAGGVVENNEGKLLLIFRNGKWDLPKGKLESGEISEPASLREVEEECGIHGHIIEKKLIPTYHCYPLTGSWVFKTTWWYKMKYNGHETLVPQKEEGIEKAEWRAKNDLDDVFENTFESIKDVLKQVV
ncbi:MAG: NUDIX hydrolase [Bacteroidota bacterium]